MISNIFPTPYSSGYLHCIFFLFFFIYGFFFLEKYNAMAWHKNLANAMAPRNLQHKLK